MKEKIKMATKFKELPCVVEQNDLYRLVAVERTKQDPSTHARHVVIDLNDANSPEDYDCVDVIAEFKQVDSLGVESWSRVDTPDAVYDLLASRIRSSMRMLTGGNGSSGAGKSLPKKDKS